MPRSCSAVTKRRISGGSGDDPIHAGLGTNLVRAGSATNTLIDGTSSADGSASPVNGNRVTLPKIYVIYNGRTNAAVINLHASKGVAIAAAGGAASVVNTSGISNLEYDLLGTSAAGSLSMGSTTSALFVPNKMSLTHASGPAINLAGG